MCGLIGCQICVGAMLEMHRAEVERLRAGALLDVVPEDVDALRAEIERLRAALKELKSWLSPHSNLGGALGSRGHALQIIRAALRGEGEK